MTPHPDLVALVDGIRHDRRNALRRLVVADWFEENGDPARAEFVRLSVAAAGTPGCSLAPTAPAPRPDCWCEACAAARRLRDLTDTFLSRWEHDLREPARREWEARTRTTSLIPPEGYLRPRFRWELGFVAGVRCRLDWWMEWGPLVSQSHPVRRLRFRDQPPFTETDPPEGDGRPRHFWSSMPVGERPTRYFRGVLPAILWHSRHLCRFDPGDPSADPPVPPRMVPVRRADADLARRALSRAAVEWAALAVGVTPEPPDGE